MRGVLMPSAKPDATKDPEKMRKAEKEIGENIPEEMVGLDSEDVREVERHEE